MLLVVSVLGCDRTHDLPQVPLPPDPIVGGQWPVPEPVPVAAPALACIDRTPVIIEKLVPVPMPCQLKEAPEFATPKPSGKTVAQTNQTARMGPPKAHMINAVHVYPYMEGALYQVQAAVNQVTSLLLQPGERLSMELATGDTVRWKIATGVVGSAHGQRVVIFLKPDWPSLKTNLTIPTDRRIYLVEMQSNENGTYMAQVGWEYPQDGAVLVPAGASVAEAGPSPSTAPAERFEPSAQLCGIAAAASRLNFGYTMQSTSKRIPAWKPERIFDDGAKTYVQFPANLASTEAPVLIGRTETGDPQIVSYEPQYGCYIAHRVLNTWELRLGEQNPVVVQITRTPIRGGE